MQCAYVTMLRERLSLGGDECSGQAIAPTDRPWCRICLTARVRVSTGGVSGVEIRYRPWGFLCFLASASHRSSHPAKKAVNSPPPNRKYSLRISAIIPPTGDPRQATNRKKGNRIGPHPSPSPGRSQPFEPLTNGLGTGLPRNQSKIIVCLDPPVSSVISPPPPSIPYIHSTASPHPQIPYTTSCASLLSRTPKISHVTRYSNRPARFLALRGCATRENARGTPVLHLPSSQTLSILT